MKLKLVVCQASLDIPLSINIIFLIMTERELITSIKNKVASLEIDTDKIYVSELREIIADLEKLEVSLTKESSLVMMGAIAQSLGD